MTTRTTTSPIWTSRRFRRSAGGFTITEMLVVIFIIVIVLALVVGVSRYALDEAGKRETIAIQKTLLQAIRLYRDSEGELPREMGDGRTDNMMEDLTNCQASAEVIGRLPGDAWGGVGTPVLDGFDHEMHYKQSGGLGGSFVIISAGPDGEFNGDPDEEEDNVRSDKH